MEREQPTFDILRDMSPATVVSIPTADINVERKDGMLQTMFAYPVRMPEEYKQDFMVPVRASVLSSCRTRLAALHGENPKINEVLFGFAMASFGASLNSVAAKVPLDSTAGFVSFVILPAVFVGTMVAYVFRRRDTNRQSVELAREVLGDLPDPEHTIDVSGGE